MFFRTTKFAAAIAVVALAGMAPGASVAAPVPAPHSAHRSQWHWVQNHWVFVFDRQAGQNPLRDVAVPKPRPKHPTVEAALKPR